MNDTEPRSVRPSAPALARLLPLADRVEALARLSARAFVERDAALAGQVLAEGGEYERVDSSLTAAWEQLLREARSDIPTNADFVSSLQQITELAGTICAEVLGLSTGDARLPQPAIERLAEIVPDLVRDAVGAFRANDRTTADGVLRQSVSVDACFAQTYLDLLQVVRNHPANLELARRFHLVTRALERIGDTASQIADSVRAPIVRATA